MDLRVPFNYSASLQQWTFPSPIAIFGGPLTCLLRRKCGEGGNDDNDPCYFGGLVCRQHVQRSASPPPLEQAWLRAQILRDTRYLRLSKRHVLDALEVYIPALAGAADIWAPGSRILDVGAGSGELSAFFAKKYKLNVSALDILAPSVNKWAGASAGGHQKVNAFPVGVFDGSRLPAQGLDYDTVLFNSVLHHAAHNTPSLLREASRVAAKFVLVAEDVLTEGEGTPAGVARAIRTYLTKRHDPKGIFRTQSEWMRLLQHGLGPDFELCGAPGAMLEVSSVPTSRSLNYSRTPGLPQAQPGGTSARHFSAAMGAGFGALFHRTFVFRRVSGAYL